MAIELRCECGFLATGTDEATFVSAAQQHARSTHQIEVPAATLLARATTTRAPAATTPDGTGTPVQ
ncbi:MAG TPA: DUF1059 domain-containing protein [Jatrophihabitantaceae bacterium]|nr:DUF1059 domain-containing protein [Jatrophihabitantaceae bacterium]